jgi:hypothetical protein
MGQAVPSICRIAEQGEQNIAMAPFKGIWTAEEILTSYRYLTSFPARDQPIPLPPCCHRNAGRRRLDNLPGLDHASNALSLLQHADVGEWVRLHQDDVSPFAGFKRARMLRNADSVSGSTSRAFLPATLNGVPQSVLMAILTPASCA